MKLPALLIGIGLFMLGAGLNMPGESVDLPPDSYVLDVKSEQLSGNPGDTIHILADWLREKKETA